MGVAKDSMICAVHCLDFYNMQPIHAGGWVWLRRTFDLPARQCRKKIESGSGERGPTGFPRLRVSVRSDGRKFQAQGKGVENFGSIIRDMDLRVAGIPS